METRLYSDTANPPLQSGPGNISIEPPLDYYHFRNFDHDMIRGMEQIKISEFKATCLAVLARVQQTGKPILVTRFGKPVAQVVPPSRPAPESWLGAMRGRGAIVGDLIEPVSTPEDWEAFRSGPGAADQRLLACPDIDSVSAR